jgi:hypothetical protein
MGDFTSTDKTPEEQQETKIRYLQKAYNLSSICNTLGITEEHVYLSSKKLPKGWDPKKLYGKESKSDPETTSALLSFGKEKILAIQAIVYLYKSLIISKNYQGTHFERLFVRYSRKHFK